MYPTYVLGERKPVTKSDVFDAAFSIVCEQGLSSLTYETISSHLECELQDVISLSISIEDLVSIVKSKARDHYNTYVEKGFQMVPPFKGFAIEHIWFAMDEPNLYKLLFFSEKYNSLDESMEAEGHHERAVLCAMETFGLLKEQAESVYSTMWFTLLGMTAHIVMGTYRLSIAEASAILGKQCRALIMEVRSGEDKREGYVPTEGSNGPSGDVSEYINNGLAKIRSRQNAALLEGLISQNRILKSLHEEAHYIRDAEWVELFRLMEVGFGISRQDILKKYPFLSTSDIRMIVLCRLGFGIGASASMLGISPASVTKARQRLKGKVQKNSVEEFVASL